MKRIIAKIMLSMVLINGVPVHMHCAPVSATTWSDTLKSGGRVALQALHSITKSGLRAIAKNPGWTSLIAAGVLCNIAMIVQYKLDAVQDKIALENFLKAKKKQAQANKMDPAQSIKEVTASPTSLFVEPKVLASEDGMYGEIDATTAFGQAQKSEAAVAATNMPDVMDHSKVEMKLRKAISDRRKRILETCSGITLMTAAFACVGSIVSKAARWAGSRI